MKSRTSRFQDIHRFCTIVNLQISPGNNQPFVDFNGYFGKLMTRWNAAQCDVLSGSAIKKNGMRGSRKFCQRGPTLRVFLFLFLDNERERIQIPLKVGYIGPPAKRHLNGVLLLGRSWPNIECWLWFFRGSGPVLLKTNFCDFSGGGSGGSAPCPPSGSIHEWDIAWILCVILNANHGF